MDGVTTRSKARKAKRNKKKAKEPADISQVLDMTPTKGNKETLASATALQRDLLPEINKRFWWYNFP